MLTKFKLFNASIPCFLVLVGSAIGSPIEIGIEYAPSGNKEIVLSVTNSTGTALPVQLSKIGRGFRVFVTQETGGPKVIPSLVSQIDEGTTGTLWKPNSEIIGSFSSFQLDNISIGSHRLSVFWNAFPAWMVKLPPGIEDSYDVAVKNLLLTVNNQGDWTLKSDQQTEISTMTVEQFQEKYPAKEGTQESLLPLHQSRNVASDLRKVRLSMEEANSNKVGSEAAPVKMTNLAEFAEKSVKFKVNWTGFWIVVGLFSFLFLIIRRFTDRGS